MHVVCLAGWYPNTQNSLGGIFIHRHFLALKETMKPGDSCSLFHFAPYTHGKPIPQKINKHPEHINIIPVKQFSAKWRLLNAALYHAIVAWEMRKVLKQKPQIVHLHAADKIGFIAALFKNTGGYALWLTEHWAIFEQNVPDAYEKRGKWFQKTYRYLWNRVDKVARINQHLHAAMCRTLGSEIPSVTCYNVLDPVFVADIEKNPIATLEVETPRFLHISNFEKRKNIVPLLEAFDTFRKNYPQAQLTLIGGELPPHTQLPEGVQAFGGLPPGELIPHYRKCNALILVSDAENAPCVIVEALCYGLPILATSVGGVSEMCTAENSILIPAFQTPQAKAEKIAELLLQFKEKSRTFDSMRIHSEAFNIYAPKRVGESLWREYSKE